MDRPDTGKYLSFHISVAESVLKSFGRPSMTLRGNAFLAALAHGYVPDVGRPALDAWRRILAGEAPRDVAVQRPPAAQSPARVHYGF
jgi:hypothetical protein